MLEVKPLLFDRYSWNRGVTVRTSTVANRKELFGVARAAAHWLVPVVFSQQETTEETTKPETPTTDPPTVAQSNTAPLNTHKLATMADKVKLRSSDEEMFEVELEVAKYGHAFRHPPAFLYPNTLSNTLTNFYQLISRTQQPRPKKCNP